eukprot:TRINITY_DN7441_c0_g1_i1.p1 TRINITY_DN7441_c0_g1~~TRINITY_DN7441_c0_g1_i1.p1  ORF type:complete len:182 (+),score=13.58 TRINITY_DN7441_c0_g1_i1:317-862(+)
MVCFCYLLAAMLLCHQLSVSFAELGVCAHDGHCVTHSGTQIKCASLSNVNHAIVQVAMHGTHQMSIRQLWLAKALGFDSSGKHDGEQDDEQGDERLFRISKQLWKAHQRYESHSLCDIMSRASIRTLSPAVHLSAQDKESNVSTNCDGCLREGIRKARGQVGNCKELLATVNGSQRQCCCR